ncbi:MAG: DegT/DnrJ/EryC1/StrS family aminotransferase [Kiritimatiellae bacterium]|nr:DegT/DnrJ/EryC1/StrS family aminotransferase [Kiritimatiellia bacterium]
MSIPLVDLRTQYAGIKPEIDAAVLKVLETGAFALGPAVAEFEKKFAPYCGVKFAAGTSSGTSALHLALRALDIGPGDEVIVPAMTFVATAAAVAYSGAKPVFVDVDNTCTMDAAKVEAAITPRTKAILPVHLYGQCADMDPILAIAEKHGIPVVEDCAQAHGAEYKGRRAGSMGSVGCFSFYPGKNLGAYGEGGAVVTNREEIDKMVRVLRDWGCTQRYHHDYLGYNYRLEGVQGAVLGVKMGYIEKWTEARRRAAACYRAKLTGVPGVGLVEIAPDCEPVWHIFAVFVANRDQVVEKMHADGIGVGIHYPIPVHMQKCFAELGYKPGDFPVAERIGKEELSLPIYPEITEAQMDSVVESLKKAIA